MTGPEILYTVQMVLNAVVTLSLPAIAYYIRKLEKNTNSIVTRLIQKTGDAAELKGHAAGKTQGASEEREQQREREGLS